ncbi:MAG: heavy metal-binding domain-containing protein [Byssovorax sp.]
MSQHSQGNQAPPGGAPLPADLPQHARERLLEMRSKKLFTSDLSVNEFLLVKQAGFDPLGLVMGSSIYQIAPTIPQVPPGQPGMELYDMTRALYHARDLAMNRMEEEAEVLGADGIIGVRIVVNLNNDPQRMAWNQYKAWQRWALQNGYPRQAVNLGLNWAATYQQVAWSQWMAFCTRNGWPLQPAPWARPLTKATYALGQNTAEFLAIGTAIRHREGEHYRNLRGKPFQSDLTGQEFWTLIRAGYRPVGFVMGNCVYYVPPALLQARASQSMELSAYTHALYDARELAIERLQYEAEALGATGIVGVTVSEQEHSFRTGFSNLANAGNAALQTGELIELFVIGTAVVPMPGSGAPPRPELVIVANDAAPAPGGEGGAE